MRTDLDLQLRLGGHSPGPARLEALVRPGAVRAGRAAGIALAGILLAPIAFLLPPHLPWGLAVVVTTAVLAWREWRGVYRVCSFSGSCPRCGSPLEIRAGAQLDLPHPISCYQCHHEPVLDLR